MRGHSTTPIFPLCALLLSSMAAGPAGAQPSGTATAAFQQRAAAVEARLARQHGSAADFLAIDPEEGARLRRGELVIEQLSPAAQRLGALLHDWQGTAFVPGATAAQFEATLRRFPAYPRLFAPEVLAAHAVPGGDDHVEVVLRVRQQHAISVVLDTAYDVSFGQLDALDGYSSSRSTRIAEIEAPGTDHERALQPAEEHGFLWRLNTYWDYRQRDGGLYIRIESVSLSRSIPTGLGWALRPYVTSIPRESLQFTLRRAADALRR